MEPREVFIKLALEDTGFSLSRFLKDPSVRYGALGAAGGAGLMGLGEALRKKRPGHDRDVLGKMLSGALLGGASGTALGLGSKAMGFHGDGPVARATPAARGTAANVAGSGIAGGLGAGALFTGSLFQERKENLKDLLSLRQEGNARRVLSDLGFKPKQVPDAFLADLAQRARTSQSGRGVAEFLRGEATRAVPQYGGASVGAAQSLLDRAKVLAKDSAGSRSMLVKTLRNPYALTAAAALLGAGHYAMRGK